MLELTALIPQNRHSSLSPVELLPGPGPGENSRRSMPKALAAVFLLLLATGGTPCARADEKPNGELPARVATPPVHLIDNPATWLGFTDLVFVAPVGTGFSRGKGKEENPDKPFWDVRADIASLGSVIRLWLARHQRWTSPVWLVGESYGGFRAAAMAQTLPHDFDVIV